MAPDARHSLAGVNVATMAARRQRRAWVIPPSNSDFQTAARLSFRGAAKRRAPEWRQWTHFRIPAARNARVMHRSCALKKQRARGMPGAGAPAAACAV